MNALTKLIILFVFAGLSMSASSSLAENTDTVLAIVNGKEITIDQLKFSARKDSINLNNIDPQQKKERIDALINHQLVLEQLRKEGFDQTEQITANVQALTEAYIIKQFLIKIALGLDLSEEALKAYYEDIYLSEPEQYKIKHILLKTEDEAVTLILEIKHGADFSSLAEQKSQDKVSAQKGGDLGWLTAEDMVPSFYKTVSELTKGDFSLKPTKTPFGWHIIQLVDKIKVTPPSFDEIKKSIKEKIIKEKITDYINTLRANAKIEIK